MLLPESVATFASNLGNRSFVMKFMIKTTTIRDNFSIFLCIMTINSIVNNVVMNLTAT